MASLSSTIVEAPPTYPWKNLFPCEKRSFTVNIEQTYDSYGLGVNFNNIEGALLSYATIVITTCTEVPVFSWKTSFQVEKQYSIDIEENV